MTSEEMEKAIQFILDQQAKQASQQARHESEIQDLRAVSKVIQDNQQKLQESQQILTNAIGVLAIQADKDRDEMKVAINQMSATATAINSAVVRQELRTEKMEDQANKDRQAMASTVDKLVNSISNVHKRVSHLEDKAS